MKHSSILYLNRFKTITTLKENSSIIAFTVLFTISLFSGCLFFSTEKSKVISDLLFNFCISQKFNHSFIWIFIVTALFEAVFLISLYLFGTSLIGVAFIPSVIVLKGFFIGILLSYLYVNFKLQAIAYNLIIIIPAACISTLALIYGACNTLNLSYTLGKILISEGQSDNKPNLKRIVLQFFALLAITFLSALIQSVMFVAFIKFFEFG